MADARMLRPRWPLIGGAVALLLLLPAAAMIVGLGVRWGPGDFAAAALLLGMVGAGLDLLLRAPAGGAWRAGMAVALGAGFVTIWGNLAVGFIGGEDNPANLLFAAVPAVALAGAYVARLAASGMVRAMLATAATAAAVPLLALAAGLGWEPLALMAAGPWLLSAWLFHRDDQSRMAR